MPGLLPVATTGCSRRLGDFNWSMDPRSRELQSARQIGSSGI
jgi:hypothetical protein